MSYVAWIGSILEHHWILAIGTDLVRSSPLDLWHVSSILREFLWIVVKRRLISWELSVTEESIFGSAELDDFLNLLLDLVLRSPLLLLHELVALNLHHFFIFSRHELTLSNHLVVLLLSELNTALVHHVWVVLASHHLLLEHLLFVHVLLLLLGRQLIEIDLTHHLLLLKLHLQLLDLLLGELRGIDLHLLHLHLHHLLLLQRHVALHLLLVHGFLLLLFFQGHSLLLNRLSILINCLLLHFFFGRLLLHLAWALLLRNFGLLAWSICWWLFSGHFSWLLCRVGNCFRFGVHLW